MMARRRRRDIPPRRVPRLDPIGETLKNGSHPFGSRNSHAPSPFARNCLWPLGVGDRLPAARCAAARLFRCACRADSSRGINVRGDPPDPLLRRVLPLAEECLTAPDFAADPVGDAAAMTVPGVLHKYRGRVLLTATGACAVHCRYCFRAPFSLRRRQPGGGPLAGSTRLHRGDTSISEVILSGGDH